MSLFAALTTAVGGLAAQSSAIGNVSDNLANSQTTGFKGIDTKFSSLVTQSNLQTNDPGGVRATPHYQNDLQGSLIQSQSATSLAISGAGFFPVRSAIVNADGTTSVGTTPYYTRAGDFTLDKNGYLVNGAGYYLTGYDVDTDGFVDASHTNVILLSDLLDNPVATTNVNYSANLPASVASTTAIPFTSSPSTLQIYDALGGTHTMSFTWEKAASDAQSTATITNGITLTAYNAGTEGDDIHLIIAPEDGPPATTYSATVETVSGGVTTVDQTYTGLAAATVWADLVDAINNGQGTAGQPGYVAPSTLCSAAIPTGSTGAADPMALAVPAEITINNGITLTAVTAGTAGNDIHVILTGEDGPPATTYQAVVETITGGVTTVERTYTGLAVATVWAELVDAINNGKGAVAASAIVSAAVPAGSTGAADPDTNGDIQLADGEDEDIQLDNGADSGTNPNTWYLHVSVPGGDGIDAGTGLAQEYTATIPFTFNSSSSAGVTAGTVSSIIGSTGVGASGTYTVGVTNAAEVTLPLDFTGSGLTGGQEVIIGFGNYDSSSSGLTQFADSNATVSVSSFAQNGIPRGSFQSLDIDKNGFVSLNYDNGQNRIISQIPIVQFFAQNDLQRVSGGAYLQTLSSGIARYSAPGTNGAGTIVSNSLESSNVDIANEFTKLIEAQRVYSANARTITTADNMLQEVINIIR